MTRPSGRTPNDLRDIYFLTGFTKHAEGSCMVRFGDTHVLCNATVEDKAPYFLKGTGSGWVTAEYGMLPRSTHSRMDREAARGKQSGRTQEIQRLIGRALRSVVDLKALGEIQIKIDCDVIQADGGTRTASICGAYVALYQALEGLIKAGKLKAMPITHQVAAISCGIVNGQAVLDLDYVEDSSAQADANFVMTEDFRIIEVQTTAEEKPFTESELMDMMTLAKEGIKRITEMQRHALGLDKIAAA